MRCILKWSSLHKLYESLIGKSIFIISLVIPILNINKIGFQFDNYNYYLIGSIIISIGFFIERICLPGTIEKYSGAEIYAEDLRKRNQDEAFDCRFEFLPLYEYKNKNYLIEVSGFSKDLEEIVVEKDAEKILGQNKFVYYFGVMNFNAVNNSKLLFRILCTIFFILGACILYFPMIVAILKYFGV
jgi:hypothetical protein